MSMTRRPSTSIFSNVTVSGKELPVLSGFLQFQRNLRDIATDIDLSD